MSYLVSQLHLGEVLEAALEALEDPDLDHEAGLLIRYPNKGKAINTTTSLYRWRAAYRRENHMDTTRYDHLSIAVVPLPGDGWGVRIRDKNKNRRRIRLELPDGTLVKEV